MCLSAEYDKFMEDNKVVSMKFPVTGYRAKRRKKDVGDPGKSHQVCTGLT
jgi:hypothetical protein